MPDKHFIDTNVFLYAIDGTSPDKAARAGEWLRYLLKSDLGRANLQVMNEIANVLLKRRSQPPETVFQTVDAFAPFGLAPVDTETVAAARLIHFDTGYSWWDCLLLASAAGLGCRYFLSEDLQHDHAVRGLTIVSPFRHSPPDSKFH